MNITTQLLVLAVSAVSLMMVFPGMAKEPQNQSKATFAGGCFWCMEAPFEKLDGVHSVVSGYAGGEQVNPPYNEVSSGKTSYIERIQITYDPQKDYYE
ncbi:MAG: methionine sulfoxide reductase, partial [Calditrichaeota bacterium]